jgi:chaperonin GroEL
MSNKIVIYNVEARNALKEGVDILANAVKVTLGPKGRNVIIGKEFGSQHVTKDGVTVAREINLSDPIQNIGAQMVKEVASKTAEVAGDGTTTATVLAQAIITAGIKNVASGANPMDLKRGIDKAVIAVVENLKEQSEKVDGNNKKIMQVATISANNDHTIGKLIADAMEMVGEHGIVTIEEASGYETLVEKVDGLQFDKGYISPYFVTNSSKQEAELEMSWVLIVDKKISAMKEILGIMEYVMKSGQPLLIICDDMDHLSGDALNTLLVNKKHNKIKVCVVKSPGYGEHKKHLLEDIAIATGGQVISEDNGFVLGAISLKDLGQAKKIIVGRLTTTIVDGAGDADKIAERIAQIKDNIENTTVDLDRAKLKDRLAALSGGVAILQIGAASEVEMMEKKDRVDDALHATRAAIEEGIVGGGGVALIRAIASLKGLKGENEDENTGIQIIRRAIEEPLRQICENAGIEGSIVIQKVKEGKKDFGYNARTDTYENLIAAGVIDPTKVVRVALQNAASIAAMLLTTECVLVDEVIPL